MCQFFSLVSDGKGKVFYLDSEARKEIRKMSMDIQADSHSSIVEWFKEKGILALKADTEDKLNKYEYNPLTNEFTIDQLNTKDDSKRVEKICNGLNFKTIAPELVIKPIFHPLKKKRIYISKKDIANLKKWASVGVSVMDSVMDSVGASVMDSVGAIVWDSVRDSVGASVWDSVGASVWVSVGAIDWAIVWDSVWAYMSSFIKLDRWKYIKHKKGINPFQCCIDLWERSLVPSFDGTTWRLHSGRNANIVFEITKEELKKEEQNERRSVRM